MRFKDYYRIMGVDPGIGADGLKSAYRALARRYHPDVNRDKGAEKRFTEIGEANEVLKDPERRAAYDRLRAAGWRDGQEMEVPAAAAEPERGRPDDDQDQRFADYLQSLFGRQGGGGRRGGFARGFSGRGADSQFPFTVSLEEAFAGGERQFRYQTHEADGAGGLAPVTRGITVTIPPGVIHGTRIRLRGQGQPGAAPGEEGDLYLAIELAPHHLFRIEGRDLVLELPLAPWEAVLGTRVEVPTLGGPVTATIPAGARNGGRLRLKGRGLPGDPPGDQYLVLGLALPAGASAKALELYRALAKEEGPALRSHLRG